MAEPQQETRNALWRREEQLNRWLLSETNKERPERKSSGSVRFQDGCVFLAACSSGDKDEVKRLICKGADINTANVDGLTALHQACIDGNLDMVKYLIDLGAGIDVCDNEGWTALHATASCGLLDIARYLISQGASVSAVNNDGELAFDLAEGEPMENLLAEEMDKQGIDAEAARCEEEVMMMNDANHWLLNGYNEEPHPKTGATALHVAAAKGYVQVMNTLLQAGANVDAKDLDGWTPMHAAAHWGQDEACKVLSENFCNMDIKNSVGQTALDVADPEIEDYVAELKKNQALMKQNRDEKTINELNSRPQIKRRSSVTRLSLDQKHNIVQKSVEQERTNFEELRKVVEERDDTGSDKKSETGESIDDDTSSGVENDEEEEESGDEESEEESSESDTEKQNEKNNKISQENKSQTSEELPVTNTTTVEIIDSDRNQNKPDPALELKPPPTKSGTNNNLKPSTENPTFEKDDPLNSKLSQRDTNFKLRKNDDKENQRNDEFEKKDLLTEKQTKDNNENDSKQQQDRLKLGFSKLTTQEGDSEEVFNETDRKPLNSNKYPFTTKPSSFSTSSKVVMRQTSAQIKTPTTPLEGDPSLWRAGLRKTGSSSAVPSESSSKASELARSASSSWVHNNKEDSGRTKRVLSASGAESTEATRSKFNDFYARYTSLLNSKPVTGTSATMSTTTSATTPGASSSSFSSSAISSSSSSTSSSSYQPYVPSSRRRQLEQQQQQDTTTTLPTTTTSISSAATTPTTIGSTATTTVPSATAGNRRSYELPKRDEEKEVERKARAKRARETRRSTQGVTKEDIERAEETLKLANRGVEVSSDKTKSKDRDSDLLDDKSDKENKPTEDNYSLSSSRNKRNYSSSDLDKKDDDITRTSLRRARDGTHNDTSSRYLRNSSSTYPSSSINSLEQSRSDSALASTTYTSTSQSSSTNASSSAPNKAYKSRLSYTKAYLTGSGKNGEETTTTTSAGTRTTSSLSDRTSTAKKDDKDEKEDPSQKSSAIKGRRKRENRRPTGKITLEDIQGISSVDETDSKEAKEEKKEEDPLKGSRYGSGSRYSDPSGGGSYATTGSTGRDRPQSYSSGSAYTRNYTSASIDSDKGGIDYKKLYEKEKLENEKLKKETEKLKQELSDIKYDLEKAKNKHESRNSDSREKRALERKISEYEEELKSFERLRDDNNRLKEENKALTRVVSKLSK